MKTIIYLFLILNSGLIYAWSNHTLIAYPVFSSMKEVVESKKVKVETIEEFLLKNEKELEEFLFDNEIWLKNNLFYYPPLPKDLYFKATGDVKTIKERFLKSIRLNLKTKFTPYIQLLPGAKFDSSKKLHPREILTFKNAFSMYGNKLHKLESGEFVDPLDVIVSANDEPDYGLDINLYENNGQEEGRIYNFGKQPFGNAKLSFSSQAPFHIGFYHASSIVYKAAPSYGRTLPEYRIQMYQKLSSFAFSRGHDYWGWRFIGLGLHYVGDFSNPYHVTMSPGDSTIKLLYSYMFHLLGYPSKVKNLTQLNSNRHLILEKFQGLIMSKAYKENNQNHPTFIALRKKKNIGVYNKTFPIEIFAKLSWEKSGKVVKTLIENLPKKFVADPKFELNNKPETQIIDEIVLKEMGEDSFQKVQNLICELLELFSPNARAYVLSALKFKENKK